ncbi:MULTISPECIES: primosomal protein [Gordonia]|uniref:primosomal protein n=1 Tax=Gordonia TaxID=2053 RepID=UPI000BB75945|nr:MULTISPECIES: primosomal protein [Gordonia]ATD70306.1 primosomal protein [Gordonia sp. 1D]MBA5846360.1 primosomal protein [Gordonia amicalis]MDV7173392.1 primosomal protein [Gordonia amicalis]UKO93872.1 primosomal protein [Gordonia amicalis]UOG21492.1 primosomal protein [Gordonia amicalis]
MAGDIVPIELGLTDGNSFTLWAPRWREGDDEWEAFLGLDEDLYVLPGVAELAAFIRTNDDNDLVEHPAWPTIVGVQADELVPDERHTYDLVGVPELAAEDPTPEVIAELEDALEIVRILGEVCELTSVTKFFNGNPILGAVTTGTRNFEGREGLDLWVRIGRLIAKHWDDVLDAIDEVITTPKVDAKAVETAEAELEAAASAEDEDEPDDDDIEIVETADDEAEDEDDEDEDEEDEDDYDDDDFWASVGIDPIKIITRGNEYLTLRCYLGDDPVFLGTKGKIFVFTSARALSRFLADDNSHDLSDLSTFEDIRTEATNGSLEFDVIDDNVYVLPGLAEDIADGPRRMDRDQLDLAVELFTDAADYAGDDTVNEALGSSTPLGWFVDYTVNPDPKRMAPSGPFDNEAEAWRALEHDFENRLVKKG